MRKKRVFVVDDSRIVRSMVRQLLESQSNYEIAGEAENGRDAVAKAKIDLEKVRVALDTVCAKPRRPERARGCILRPLAIKEAKRR